MFHPITEVRFAVTWPDGETFVGEFENNQRAGQGRCDISSINEHARVFIFLCMQTNLPMVGCMRASTKTIAGMAMEPVCIIS